MPYDNEYNRMIAKQIKNANEEYIKRSNLVGGGISGTFIEHLANALYEHHINKHKSGGSGFGASYDPSGGEEKSEGIEGGSMDYFRGQKRPPINAKAISSNPTEGGGQSGGAMMRTIGGAGQHKYKKSSKSKLVNEMEGGNIFSDIADGFMSVVRPVAGVAKNILRVIPDPRAQAVGAVLDAVGAGKKRGRPLKLTLKAGQSSSMSGMGRSGGGSTGGGSTGGGSTGGGSTGGGRSVRASIVKDVMKQRGVSMIEASKIVKSEGLYTPK
jgi:hypothetical protein